MELRLSLTSCSWEWLPSYLILLSTLPVSYSGYQLVKRRSPFIRFDLFPYYGDIGLRDIEMNEAVVIILFPGLISVDHGHFQSVHFHNYFISRMFRYNSVSLGFFLISVYFLVLRRTIIASVFFVLALNYKQVYCSRWIKHYPSRIHQMC